MNPNFIVYLELVEDLHLGFVTVDIVLYVTSRVSWKWYAYMVGEIHKVLGSHIVRRGFEWHDYKFESKPCKWNCW